MLQVYIRIARIITQSLRKLQSRNQTNICANPRTYNDFIIRIAVVILYLHDYWLTARSESRLVRIQYRLLMLREFSGHGDHKNCFPKREVFLFLLQAFLEAIVKQLVVVQ